MLQRKRRGAGRDIRIGESDRYERKRDESEKVERKRRRGGGGVRGAYEEKRQHIIIINIPGKMSQSVAGQWEARKKAIRVGGKNWSR